MSTDHSARQAVSRQETQARYDRLSRWYDLLTRWSENKLRSVGLQVLDSRPGERLLEIGCGTGRTILELDQSVGEYGCIVGIDLSAGMIDKARQQIKATSSQGCVALVRTDATALPFKPASFDAVWMSFTLELFGDEEIPRVIDECKRVITYVGRLCFLAMSQGSRSGLMSRIYRWM
jgi:ubiquinone/menaquinone biosynthesis C-methylase UbiE